MEHYAFFSPVLEGREEDWRNYIREMNGPRRKERDESRERAGMKIERVWLQRSASGVFAVVYFEADNVARAFEFLMKSEAPFDTWFRDRILVGVHGMDVSQPLPMNELMLDFSALPSESVAA